MRLARRPGKAPKSLAPLGLLSHFPTHIKALGGIGVYMLITCPNCRTRYTLQPAQLGNGRKVSCSNCTHVWYADPRDALPDPPPQRRAAPQPAYAAQAYGQPAYAPQGYGQPPYPPPGYMPQPGYAPQGYAPAMAQPMAQPAPPPPPQPAPPPPMPAPEPDPIPELEEDAADPMAGLPTDINDMFEDDEEIEPFQSLITNDDEEDSLDDLDSPDQMEDPDYIPEVFSADEQEPDDEEPSGSPILKIILILFMVLILGTVGAAFFMKDKLVELVPQLEGVYDMLGFHQVGEGLQIQRVQSAQETDAGLEVLVVRGQIQNVSSKIRPVPPVRAVLIDAEGAEIQHVDAAPIKSELKANETISFKIRINEPSPVRRQLKVIFIDPKDAGAAHGKPAPAAGHH